MTEHNPWTREASTSPEPDEEVETVEAERLPTLNELADKTLQEQLDALTGKPVEPMTGWRRCTPS